MKFQGVDSESLKRARKKAQRGPQMDFCTIFMLELPLLGRLSLLVLRNGQVLGEVARRVSLLSVAPKEWLCPTITPLALKAR